MIRPVIRLRLFTLPAFLLLTTLVSGALFPAPARAQDAAELLLRLSRMENQVRQMTGQIEQLQQQNRRLEDDLQRFRKDTDLRFEDTAGGKGGAGAAAGSPAPAAARPAGSPARRNDAFDPNANPSAPGAPRALGTTPPSAPLQTAPSGRRGDAGGTMPMQLDGQPGAAAAAAPPPRIGPSVAASSGGDTRAEFAQAQDMMKRGEYANAEMAFRQFLQAHPKSTLVAEATFQLGETYNQRSQYREAAEQYLKVSTAWPQSTRAATAMLRLGVALNALGAKDQACATLQEIDKRYPNASAIVKRGVEREFRRAKCEA
ncbi:MAG: tol-pal system protein YbgF [Beijerinckiaceae bacterium]